MTDDIVDGSIVDISILIPVWLMPYIDMTPLRLKVIGAMVGDVPACAFPELIEEPPAGISIGEDTGRGVDVGCCCSLWAAAGPHAISKASVPLASAMMTGFIGSAKDTT